MRAILVSLVLSVVLFPRPGAAMRIRSETRLLAVAGDGRSLLFEDRAQGPEGGGSYAVVLFSADKPHQQTFQFSRDFSLGDGSTPQTVSTPACQAALRQLGEALKAKAFRGVKVAANCAQRLSLVTVSEAEQARAAALKFVEGAGKLTWGAWQVDTSQSELMLTGPTGSAPLVPYYRPKQMGLIATPDMRVVVLLGREDWMEAHVAGVWVVPGKFPQTLTLVPRRDR